MVHAAADLNVWVASNAEGPTKGHRVGAGLIIYAIYILAVLIWSVLRTTSLRYVAISIDMLNRWAANCQNLIIIDLRAKLIRQSHRQGIPDALNVSIVELPSLLQWVPPQTTLIFCCQYEIQHFDTRIEELLSHAEINAVYLLVFPICAPDAEVRIPGSGDERSGNDALFPVDHNGRKHLEPWQQHEYKN
jgi:hypothetical protein